MINSNKIHSFQKVTIRSVKLYCLKTRQISYLIPLFLKFRDNNYLDEFSIVRYSINERFIIHGCFY